MNGLFDVSTESSRRFFAEVWQQRLNPSLQPIQLMALRIIQAHPEYQYYLDEIDRYVDFVWAPELGISNPFLHLSLHLSIEEQVSIDQPPGIRSIHRQLCRQEGHWNPAEDKMMAALVEMIWQTQKYRRGFDVNLYLTTLRKLVHWGAEDKPRLNPHEI